MLLSLVPARLYLLMVYLIMQKAVAIPYVIALVLGIAVIGLVGFWFVSSGGKFGGQSSKTICDNKFLQWCVAGTGSSFDSYAPECANIASGNCNELTGVNVCCSSS